MNDNASRIGFSFRIRLMAPYTYFVAQPSSPAQSVTTPRYRVSANGAGRRPGSFRPTDDTAEKNGMPEQVIHNTFPPTRACKKSPAHAAPQKWPAGCGPILNRPSDTGKLLWARLMRASSQGPVLMRASSQGPVLMRATTKVVNGLPQSAPKPPDAFSAPLGLGLKLNCRPLNDALQITAHAITTTNA